MSENFTFTYTDGERKRLDNLAYFLSDGALTNTHRRMLLKLAAEGEPLDIIGRFLLAFRDELSYSASRLDLEDPVQLERAIQLVRERKTIQWTIDFLQRCLTLMPEKETEA